MIGNREGALELTLRRAILRRAGVIDAEPGDDDEVPESLRPYVDKVVRNAYKVTDEDFEALRASYGSRQIYEISVAAAVGAASARREAAIALLRGNGAGS